MEYFPRSEYVTCVVTIFVAHATSINNQTDMAMKDPVPQFTDVITRIRDLYPDFSYIHIVEPRIDGHISRDAISSRETSQSDLVSRWPRRRAI